MTQRIPDAGEHLKSRGLRAKGQASPARSEGEAAASPSAKEARKRWAALIKEVYEIDPLSGPKCGTEKKIISFIERDQSEVIEKTLRHCGLWDEAPARGPPAVQEPVVG